jgi:hypothetical protein
LHWTKVSQTIATIPELLADPIGGVREMSSYFAMISLALASVLALTEMTAVKVPPSWNPVGVHKSESLQTCANIMERRTRDKAIAVDIGEIVGLHSTDWLEVSEGVVVNHLVDDLDGDQESHV